ncbi:MAG: LexA family protein [bacterium]
MSSDESGKNSTVVTEVFTADQSTDYELPLAEVSVQAGFPSPAEDYIEDRIDLNEHLIDNPAATYFVRVAGASMVEAGIHDGDILVVDRALEPVDGKVVVASIDGNLSVKRLKKSDDTVYLVAENDDYEDIEVTPHNDFQVWGIVTYVIHPV